MEADFQIDNKLSLQEEYEGKLKLPVVTTRTGTTFVLDPFGEDARILAKRKSVSRPDFSRAELSAKSRRMASRNHRVLAMRLFAQYADVSAESADAAIRKLASAGDRQKSVHITIETGPTPIDWGRLQKYAGSILSSFAKSKIRAGMTIEGVFNRPGSRIMGWLASQRVIVRFILGSELDYPVDLKSENAKVLSAMSQYGLRVPVLYYWSGQGGIEIAGVLKKALLLNKLAGVGVLPYYLSPRFDCRTRPVGRELEGFSDVITFLHTDRLLSEFLDEPVSDIEARLGNWLGARCARAIITKSAEMLFFRRFPFAAGKSRFKTAISGRCKKCVWKQICGGIDRSPAAFRRQHKIIADAWCLNQKILMRRVIAECLEIRERLSQIKDNLLKDAS
jgi:hypothetical protein